jgi:hypothetical protein
MTKTVIPLNPDTLTFFYVRPEETFCPGKYKKRVEARSVLSYRAVRELGETASAIAKKIGISRNPLSVCQLNGGKEL